MRTTNTKILHSHQNQPQLGLNHKVNAALKPSSTNVDEDDPKELSSESERDSNTLLSTTAYPEATINPLTGFPLYAEALVTDSGRKVLLGSVSGIEKATTVSEGMSMWTMAGLGIAAGGGIALAAGGGGGKSASTPASPSPVFTSATTANADENSIGIVYDATADNDVGISYTIGGTDGSLFDIDTSTGQVRFIESPDFENPLDSNGDNVYLFTIGAQNTSGQSTSHTVELTVQDCLGWNDPLDVHQTALWSMSDGWGNGGVFASDWSADQIAFDLGTMNLTLETVDNVLVSGEYRSIDEYGYGYYEVSLKASDTPGTINGFFTYTGPSEGTAHHEIDVEIKGDDPTRMQINYWTDGVEHPVTIALGFDASEQFHTYAFSWREESIEWYVDGVAVHTEDGSNGPLPTLPGKIMINLWATEGAGEWSSDYTVANGSALLSVDYIAAESYQSSNVI